VNLIELNHVLTRASETAGTGKGQAKHLKSSVVTMITGRMMPRPGSKYGLLQEWLI